MAQDLERRENEFKKRSGEMNEKARDERSALERIKEDGRRRREEADKVNLDSINQGEQEQKRQAKELKKQKLAESNSGALPLGPLDTTLKLKWLRSLHPTLITPTALSTFLGTTLSVFDPEIDTIALSAKFLANTAKGKYGSGVVAFKSLRAAMRLIEATSQLVEGETRKGWEGFEVTWASGSPPECLGLTPEAVPAAKLSPAVRSSFALSKCATDFFLVDVCRFGRGSYTSTTTRAGTSQDNSRSRTTRSGRIVIP